MLDVYVRFPTTSSQSNLILTGAYAYDIKKFVRNNRD